MKTTDQLQNPQRTLLADSPRVRAQIPPRESEQGLAPIPPAVAPPGVPMPSEVSTEASVPALMVPEDYRARAVAVQARERILRSPEFSSLALDGAAAFNGPSSAQPFFESPLRPLLEGVVEEVIAEIDGAPSPGALPGPSRVAYPCGESRGSCRAFVLHISQVRALPDGGPPRGATPASNTYPSTENWLCATWGLSSTGLARSICSSKRGKNSVPPSPIST